VCIDHRSKQLFGIDRLGQIAHRACGQRPEDHVRIIEDRQHDELGFGHQRRKPGHAVHAAFARQIDIHQHHIGAQRRQPGACLFGRREDSLADCIRSTLDNLAETAAQASIVLHDRH
jgi:hypothetical protein